MWNLHLMGTRPKSCLVVIPRSKRIALAFMPHVSQPPLGPCLPLPLHATGMPEDMEEDSEEEEEGEEGEGEDWQQQQQGAGQGAVGEEGASEESILLVQEFSGLPRGQAIELLLLFGSPQGVLAHLFP